MGTNFYSRGGRHIGKRSAAGWYCWDCKQTLCANGEQYVHYTKLPPNEVELKRDRERLVAHPGLSPSGFPTVLENEWMRRDVTWHKKCPKCGKRPPNESLADGAVGRELGFNKKLTTKKGITSCSSFSWAMPRKEALQLSKVRDEYGREYSHKEFIAVIEDCPIHFTDMMGTRFS
jgi:hypothetical protein